MYLMEEQAGRGRSTFTSDMVDSSAWQSNVQAFEGQIPAWIKPSMQQDPPPMLSKVTSFDSSQSLFLDGKVLCVGDALQQITPHLGLASDAAAYQALELRKSIMNEFATQGLAGWEKRVLSYAREVADASMKEGAVRSRTRD